MGAHIRHQLLFTARKSSDALKGLRGFSSLFSESFFMFEQLGPQMRECEFMGESEGSERLQGWRGMSEAMTHQFLRLSLASS